MSGVVSAAFSHVMIPGMPLEDLRRPQLRQYVRDRRVERELALLDLLHGAGGGDRLAHRRDPENRVDGHRRGLVDLAPAEGTFVEWLAAYRRRGDDAGDLAGFGGLAQRLIDAK